MSYWEHTETEEERSKRILDSWERVKGQVDWAVLYRSTLYRRRMTTLQKFTAKAKVLATSVPTYLVIGAATVPIVADEASKVLPAGAAVWTTHVALVVVGVLGAAIAVVRRVTPVIKAERGLLPAAPPQPPTS